MADGAPPPASVVEAFGLHGEPRALPGGQGTTWRVGDVVLKPGVDARFQAWLGTELAAIEQVGFVLPEVMRCQDGAWVVQRWGAATVLPGSSRPTRDGHWFTVLQAGRAFHRATRDLPRLDWFAHRSNWWTRADHAAWGEAPMKIIPPLEPLVARLRRRVPSPGRDQLVHGDLTSNVLIGAHHPPGIIDMSPDWRPSAYADGVVIADAICWYGAEPDLLREAGVTVAAVARGLLFRALTTNAMQQDRPEPAALARDLAG